MRISSRDKRIIAYERYNGKTEKTETVGTGASAVTYRLGEYDISYGEMVVVYAYVSIPKGMAQATSGNATIEPYGTETSYRRYIISEVDLDLTTESRVWIEVDPSTGADPDYRVTRIGRSYNHYIYEVKEY